MAELRIREATRAILLTPDEHVLLVRFEFPAGRRWALPGGGIDPGESVDDALHRELFEEVGLAGTTIGPHVWSRYHEIPFLNGNYDGQREQIHLVTVPSIFEPTPAFSWEQLNAEYVFELRWWTIAQISASDERFAPGELGSLLRQLVDTGPPTAPVDVAI